MWGRGDGRPRRLFERSEVQALSTSSPRNFFDFSSTPRASFSLCASSFFTIEASPKAIICAARIPAFVAPGFPIATVATGIPAGICTVASKESIPCSEVEGIGTPITGRVV